MLCACDASRPDAKFVKETFQKRHPQAKIHSIEIQHEVVAVFCEVVYSTPEDPGNQTMEFPFVKVETGEWLISPESALELP